MPCVTLGRPVILLRTTYLHSSTAFLPSARVFGLPKRITQQVWPVVLYTSGFATRAGPRRGNNCCCRQTLCSLPEKIPTPRWPRNIVPHQAKDPVFQAVNLLHSSAPATFPPSPLCLLHVCCKFQRRSSPCVSTGYLRAWLQHPCWSSQPSLLPPVSAFRLC